MPRSAPEDSNVLKPKYPTPEQIAKLMEGSADTPVVMLNLLKFNRTAEGRDEKPSVP